MAILLRISRIAFNCCVVIAKLIIQFPLWVIGNSFINEQRIFNKMIMISYSVDLKCFLMFKSLVALITLESFKRMFLMTLEMLYQALQRYLDSAPSHITLD